MGNILDNLNLLIIIVVLFLVTILIVVLLLHLNKNQMLQQTQKQMSDLHLGITKEISDFQLNMTNAIKGDINTYNEATINRMTNIEKQVNDNLRVNMEKTNKAFTDVMVQMTKIQEAQQNLTSLSTEINSLQNVLTDKKQRGTYGEIELYSILESSFGVNDQRFMKQYKLSNGNMVDAVVVAPEPLGLIPVDSKFPLENYNRMYNQELTKEQQEQARRQFKNDCIKHIKDISSKYVTAAETSDFAYMFIPAEAVFAEIYGHYEEVIEESYKNKVYIVSPTTLMAYITAIKAIYLGQSKNERVVEMQSELQKLAVEFDRFNSRWNNVTKDFEKVNADIQQIDTTAKKIINQFTKIDNVELEQVNVDVKMIKND